MTAQEYLKNRLGLTYLGILMGKSKTFLKQKCVWCIGTQGWTDHLGYWVHSLTYVDNHRNDVQSRSPYRLYATHHPSPMSVVILDTTGPEVSPGWISPSPGSSGWYWDLLPVRTSSPRLRGQGAFWPRQPWFYSVIPRSASLHSVALLQK